MHSLACLVLLSALLAPAAAFGERPAVGDHAPDFALVGSDGKTYALAQYRFKQAVVVAWYPRAFTAGCTVECKSLAKNGERIREFDVAYFMASVDAPEDNARFAKEQQADFPVLSDPSKLVAHAYGVLAPDGNYAQRWTFYIGKDGRILAIDEAVNPATAAEDMLARLEKLGVPKRAAEASE